MMFLLHCLALFWLLPSLGGSLNFWALDNMFDPCHTGGMPVVFSAQLSFDCEDANNTSRSSWSGSISCGGGLNIDPKNDKPLIQDIPAEQDTCVWLRNWMYQTPFSKAEAKLQYDTLRLYIEICAAKDDESWKAFTHITSAVKLYSTDTQRWEQYREWLISVIYLSPDDKYFCACLGQIENSFQYGKYHPTIASLAIRDFIRKHEQRCWSPIGDKDYSEDSTWAEEHGLDPTDLPPLDSLGLGFLLKSGVRPEGALAQTYLSSFSASPNPFRDEVWLNFHLNRMSYVTIQLFDLLGRVVWESGGRTFDAGDHELAVDAQSLPTGTLYARITTGFGEVKTVKLVKE